MSTYDIVRVERRRTAVVKAHVAFADLPMAERAARAKLAEALPKLRAHPTGETFTLCRMPSGGKMSIEPGVIVAEDFTADGDVVPSELPAGRAVRHLLIGPFDRLSDAWPALFAWCRNEGHALEGRFWQVYGPASSDPAEQQTTLYALLA